MAFQREQFNYQKQKDAKSASISKSSGSSSRSKKSGSVSTKAAGAIVGKKTTDNNDSVSASDYIEKLIASGADKDTVANEIALALRKGEITAKEATKLRETFTPRGVQY